MGERIVAVTTEHDAIADMCSEARYKANNVSWDVSSESDQGIMIPNKEEGIKELIMKTQGGFQDEREMGKKNTVGKGGLSTWKRVAREKENVVPVMEIKKRLFKDLTNGKGESINGEASNTKKARQECGEDGRWRTEIMQQIFSTEEIEAIMKIPQNARRRDDRWTWSLTTQGDFSVKTAYHAYHSSKISHVTDSEHCNVWKTVWKMNTLPSTKLFMWRAVKDILPTAEALKKRGMDIDEQCSLCGLEVESCLHALVGCEQVRHFWRDTGLPFVLEMDGEVGFREWFNIAITQWDPRNLELFSMAAQKIWERRNRYRVEERETRLEGLWSQVNDVWKELNEEDAPSRNNACATNLEKWQPPSWRFLKLNVDAIMREGMPSRVGCIIRNHTGRYLVAMTKRFEVATTVDTLEALAVYEGLMLAKSMSILNI
ncbi:reverse transcriptase [Senna tora]|uniref:Reverse transcriptase n=1 Tax=Senna tora TaxID=362788 RepID=A0A834SMB1_9FABA|nr:reverse transcriptase [Senna tora]